MAFSGSGAGIEGDPYIITTVDQLQEMEDDLTAWYELGNDIDASATSDWNEGAGFADVGASDPNEFKGHLDGKGYTISDLFIYRPDESVVGLFGQARDATIENVILADVNITGLSNVGALVGSAFGDILIDNCSSSGSITGISAKVGGLVGLFQDTENEGGVISNSYSSCSVNSESVQVGGFIGTVSYAGTITLCYATGNVSGDYQVGGFIGDSHTVTCTAVISKCFSSGDVLGNDPTSSRGIGGFAGRLCQDIDVNNCYACGDVRGGRSTGDDYLAGFCGYTYLETVSITNCWGSGKVTSYEATPTYVGGFLGKRYSGVAVVTDCFWDIQTSGQNTSAGGTGKTTRQMVREATFTNWDFDTIWGIIEGQTYPYLLGIPFPFYLPLLVSAVNKSIHNIGMNFRY